MVKNSPDVEILGPLGINRLLGDKEFSSIKRQEAGWFQVFKTKNSNEIAFLPAKHWHRRSFFDFNKVLWGGFGIRADNMKIYFAGDTAKEVDFFNQINEIYNGFDICIIPIGAYSPKFLMENEHVNPAEAIEAFQLLDGNLLIPMHYGTYDLSDEPLGEPLKLLREKAEDNNMKNQIVEMSIGQIIYMDSILIKN